MLKLTLTQVFNISYDQEQKTYHNTLSCILEKENQTIFSPDLYMFVMKGNPPTTYYTISLGFAPEFDLISLALRAVNAFVLDAAIIFYQMPLSKLLLQYSSE